MPIRFGNSSYYIASQNISVSAALVGVSHFSISFRESKMLVNRKSVIIAKHYGPILMRAHPPMFDISVTVRKNRQHWIHGLFTDFKHVFPSPANKKWVSLKECNF